MDNLANLLVPSGEGQVTRGKGRVASEEITRVLCPGGVALTLDPRLSTLDPLRKPWPEEIDEWTHYLYNA